MKTLYVITSLLFTQIAFADQAYVICGKTFFRDEQPSDGSSGKPGLATNEARMALNTEISKVMVREEAAGNRVEVSAPTFQRDTETILRSKREHSVDLACVTVTIRKK